MEKNNTLKNNPTMNDDYLFSCSYQDCTGLIPSGMHNDWELENYEELYHYLPPTNIPMQHFPGEAEHSSTFPLRAALQHQPPLMAPLPRCAAPAGTSHKPLRDGRIERQGRLTRCAPPPQAPHRRAPRPHRPAPQLWLQPCSALGSSHTQCPEPGQAPRAHVRSRRGHARCRRSSPAHL